MSRHHMQTALQDGDNGARSGQETLHMTLPDRITAIGMSFETQDALPENFACLPHRAPAAAARLRVDELEAPRE